MAISAGKPTLSGHLEVKRPTSMDNPYQEHLKEGWRIARTLHARHLEQKRCNENRAITQSQKDMHERHEDLYPYW